MPDPRNLFRDCKKTSLDPRQRQMILQMVDMEVFVVMNKLKELELKALEMRHQHLKSRLQATKDEKNNTESE